MKNLFRPAIFGYLLCLAFSCSNEPHIKIGTVNDLSPYARQFFGLSGSGATAMANSHATGPNQSPTAPLATSYSAAYNSPRVTADSTVIIDQGTNCGTYTQTFHPDGSITVVLDYGDGCVQGDSLYSYTQWGRMTYTTLDRITRKGTVISSEYSYESLMANLGVSYVYMGDTTVSISDGNTMFAGNTEYDSVSQVYTSAAHWNDVSTYTYDKVKYSYTSSGASDYTNSRSVIKSNEYKYGSGDDYYHSIVTIPVVRDYTCQLTNNSVLYANTMARTLSSFVYWMPPVSGHEVITYHQDGKEGGFEIDYGDGSCDSFVDVYEDGKVIRIDIGSGIQPAID